MSGQRARFFTLILSSLILLCSSAGAQEFGVPLELQKAVHFLTADGQIVKMEAGSYLLEQDELNLRLWPVSGDESLLLKTSIMSHDQPVAGPVALSVIGKGAYPDIHMVVLMLPAGEGLRGIGTYSGVMPRGWWNDVVDVVDDAVDDVVDVVDDAVDVVDDVADDVVDGADWVIDQVDDAASEAMNLAVNTFEEVGPEALEMLDDAGDMYQQAQDLAYQAATNPNLAEDLLNQAAELAQQATEVTVQALEDSWEAAVEAATWLYEEADRYLKELVCKAMVYMFQGMDVLAELSGPAAAALNEVTAPINQVVEAAANEVMELVGGQDTIDSIKVALEDGVQDMVPQFSIIVGMLEEIQYTREQLRKLKGLMFSPSVCELSQDELKSRMRDIMDPWRARLTQSASQSTASWPEMPTATDPIKEGGGEDEDISLLGSLVTLETVSVSSHPPLPSGLKATFRNAEGTASSSTCQVIKSGSLTCWAYSYLDNRSAFGVVAYDQDGNVVEQWEKRGARYLSRIVLHPDTQTIEFVGQADRTATMDWTEIAAVQPPDVPDPPDLVVVQDRPADDTDFVPPAPPEELEDDPVEVEDIPVEPVVVQDKPAKGSDIVSPAPPVKIDDDPAVIADAPVAPVITEAKTPKINKTPAIAATSISPAVTTEPVKAVSVSRLDSETKKPKSRWKRSFKTRRRGNAGNLDQDWTPRTREGQDIHAGGTLAQTFTVSKEGLLSAIALRINRRAWANSDLTVDIRRVLKNGVPPKSSATALFTTTLSPENIPLAFSETMTEIDVRSAGIAVLPGEILAVTVTNQGVAKYIWWDLEGYDGGHGLGLENGEWVEIDSDLVFQAEVDADAPIISTRGGNTGVSIDEPLDQVFGTENAFPDVAQSRSFDLSTGPSGASRRYCLGRNCEIQGITLTKNPEVKSQLSDIRIEVFKSYSDYDNGEAKYDSGVLHPSKGVDQIDTIIHRLTLNLMEEKVTGRIVVVHVKSDEALDDINIWAKEDWNYWYAGIDISASIKNIAFSLGMGSSFSEFNPMTSFSVGAALFADDSIELAGQIGWFPREPGPGHSFIVGGEIEMIKDFFPNQKEGTFVTTEDGISYRVGNLQWNKVHGAVHLDILFDSELLWSLLFQGNECLNFGDTVQAIVLTIGAEKEYGKLPDSRWGGDVNISVGYTWDWFLGL